MHRPVEAIVAAMLLILLAPILFIVAAGIRLDSRGPVFFTQERVGRDGRPFRIIKFRTMHPGTDPSALSASRSDDERITRVGRFLWAAKLDEMPQLVNVLLGHMSFVGPRPMPRSELETYLPGEDQRLRLRSSVRPGITSPWCISADQPKDRPSIAMLEADLAYVAAKCAREDLRVALWTARFVVTRFCRHAGVGPRAQAREADA